MRTGMTYPIVNISCGKCGKSYYAKENGCFAPSCLCDDLEVNQRTQEGEETKPFTCPVCQGKGTVANGFYDPYSGWVWNPWNLGSGGSYYINYYETCKSCQGTGVVWGNNEKI